MNQRKNKEKFISNLMEKERGLCVSRCRSPPFFVQKIGFEILDEKEDFTNDR